MSKLIALYVWLKDKYISWLFYALCLTVIPISLMYGVRNLGEWAVWTYMGIYAIIANFIFFLKFNPVLFLGTATLAKEALGLTEVAFDTVVAPLRFIGIDINSINTKPLKDRIGFYVGIYVRFALWTILIVLLLMWVIGKRAVPDVWVWPLAVVSLVILIAGFLSGEKAQWKKFMRFVYVGATIYGSMLFYSAITQSFMSPSTIARAESKVRLAQIAEVKDEIIQKEIDRILAKDPNADLSQISLDGVHTLEQENLRLGEKEKRETPLGRILYPAKEGFIDPAWNALMREPDVMANPRSEFWGLRKVTKREQRFVTYYDGEVLKYKASKPFQLRIYNPATKDEAVSGKSETFPGESNYVYWTGCAEGCAVYISASTPFTLGFQFCPCNKDQDCKKNTEAECDPPPRLARRQRQ